MVDKTSCDSSIPLIFEVPLHWLAKSNDLGFSFEVSQSFENKYSFEDWFQYRASIVNINQKNKVQIFYTAVDKKNVCYIARKEQQISDFKF